MLSRGCSLYTYTVVKAVKTCNDLAKSNDSGKQTDMDIAKAFDTVPHNTSCNGTVLLVMPINLSK